MADKKGKVVGNVRGTDIYSTDPNVKTMEELMWERKEKKRIEEERKALEEAAKNYKKRNGR